jgi:hypothetical protein
MPNSKLFSRVFILSAVVVGAVALSPLRSARATVVMEMNLDGLVGRADEIIVGAVKESSSRWTSDGRYIVTDTVIEVSQTVHGKARDRVIVRRLGGTVGEIGMRVAGTVDLMPDTRVLLFIQKRRGHHYVVGMRQGAMRLEKNAKGKELVIKDLGNMALARRSGEETRLQLYHARANEPPQTLERFVDRIRDAVKRCKSQPARCR